MDPQQYWSIKLIMKTKTTLMLLGKMDTMVKITTQINKPIIIIADQMDQQNVPIVRSLDMQWRNASQSFHIIYLKMVNDKKTPMKEQMLVEKDLANSVKKMATQLTNVMH